MSLNDWIEVFRAGTHTAMDGKTYTYGPDDLNDIIRKYDPEVHESPIVIGHPRDNAPAYGWVEGLRRQGDVLYAKLKQVQPEFEKMVKQGLFKKRSVSLHPQYGLNHIGFLGALPPAVAGLKDISFMQSGDDCVVIEYAQHEVKTMRIEEQKQIADYKTKLEAYASEIKAKDEKIATLEAELDQKEVEQASFASAQKTELEQAQVRIKTLEDNCKKRDCHEFAGKLVDEGKLTKAEEVGVINFMMKLEEAEMKEYQKQLEARPRLVEFGEKYASPGLAATGVVHYNYGVEVDAERADLDQKVLEYAKSNNVDYEKALNIVIGK